MKKNFRFTICYDGSRYHGWERKNNVDTIQGKLEMVLSKMVNEEVRINGAGRTDAGVHAKAMIANGILDTDMSVRDIKDYVNKYLPDDIAVMSVEIASDRFHARLNATGKTYRYRCYVGDEKPIFDRVYTWVLPEWVIRNSDSRLPNLSDMKAAAGLLVGKHDFKSFCGNNKMKKSTVRTIYNIDIYMENGYLIMDFSGDGFLQNMVRILTGTLLETGYGRIKPEEINHILEVRDRQAAGPTAPPCGLTLLEVRY